MQRRSYPGGGHGQHGAAEVERGRERWPRGIGNAHDGTRARTGIGVGVIGIGPFKRIAPREDEPGIGPTFRADGTVRASIPGSRRSAAGAGPVRWGFGRPIHRFVRRTIRSSPSACTRAFISPLPRRRPCSTILSRVSTAIAARSSAPGKVGAASGRTFAVGEAGESIAHLRWRVRGLRGIRADTPEYGRSPHAALNDTPDAPCD